MVLDGRRVGSPIRATTRQLLRTQAAAEWRLRKVQGKLAMQAEEAFSPALDMRFFVRAEVPSRFARWLLPEDADRNTIDLSRMLYRCHRAIGGSWTEQLKTDVSLARLAQAWAHTHRQSSPRLCPLCVQEAGTPRHAIMTCEALRPLSDKLRSDMELLLVSVAGREHLIQAADAWRDKCTGT